MREELYVDAKELHRLKSQNAGMVKALKEAKALIKFWHNGVDPHQDAWEVYQHSPEMKRINEAIKKTQNEN